MVALYFGALGVRMESVAALARSRQLRRHIQYDESYSVA
jgi:hypothetical protein